MPDTKITALTAIGANPIIPSTFPIPMVDLTDTSMAASGTTKKVTVNQILGAGGTATLASATITGDLTVDTSTLKVDSGNDRVGIQSTILNSRLTVRAGTLAGIDIYRDDANANFSGIRFKGTTNSTVNGQIGWSGTQLRIEGTDELLIVTNSSDRFRVSTSGVFTFENVGGVAGTAMTLNSTGLGVGVTPGYKLDVRSAPATNAIEGSRISDATRTIIAGQTGATYSYLGIGANQNVIYTSGGRLDIVADSQSLFLRTGTNNYLNLDPSGNVGIGVTPSAWTGGGYLQLQSSRAYAFAGAFGDYISNGYYDGSWKYTTTAAVSRYRQDAGSHIWYNATSGTAGNAITFTERLRLKDTGQLRFVPLASDPSGAEAGDVYYNSTSNKLKCYNGTTWNDLF